MSQVGSDDWITDRWLDEEEKDAILAALEMWKDNELDDIHEDDDESRNLRRMSVVKKAERLIEDMTEVNGRTKTLLALIVVRRTDEETAKG